MKGLGLHLWKDSVICEVSAEATRGMLGCVGHALAYDLVPLGPHE